MIMGIFEEDEALLKSGGVQSAFKWSLIAFIVLFALNAVGFLILPENTLEGLLFLTVPPNIVLLLIYYFSLKREIGKFGLKTYSLRAEYLAMITAFVVILDVLSTLIATGQWEFPRFGIIPLILMLLVPHYVKK